MKYLIFLFVAFWFNCSAQLGLTPKEVQSQHTTVLKQNYTSDGTLYLYGVEEGYLLSFMFTPDNKCYKMAMKPLDQAAEDDMYVTLGNMAAKTSPTTWLIKGDSKGDTKITLQYLDGEAVFVFTYY